MPVLNPPNADDVRMIVEERLRALEETQGFKETVSVEWRGAARPIPVISMPVDLLTYNPSTHRVRAQRSLDAKRDAELNADPFGDGAQAYLHQLLAGDPTDPSRRDPAFEALKEDLREHGQNDPGIITRSGVLINGNTRRAALKELGYEHIRVGVLPGDASFTDLQSIELSLQLRKDHRRDYSFMNFLLAIDERVELGRPAAEIQSDFRIRATTFERSRWILAFVRDAIARSEVKAGDKTVGLRLVDFEAHQGKLEELYRSYTSLKGKSPDEAEALREQRLLAIALGKSKTDVRLIEPDFTERYMKELLPAEPVDPGKSVKVPGTSITLPGASQKVQALRALTTEILQARAVTTAARDLPPEASKSAGESLQKVDATLDGALERAGKTGRVVKRRFAAADRLSDAVEDLELALAAVSEARATGNFEAEDLDEVLTRLRRDLVKLAQLVTRGSPSSADDESLDGVAWLRAVADLG